MEYYEKQHFHLQQKKKFFLLFIFKNSLTCLSAALASTASADSVAIDTRAVGVPVVGVVAGERRGVEVKENSSGGGP